MLYECDRSVKNGEELYRSNIGLVVEWQMSVTWLLYDGFNSYMSDVGIFQKCNGIDWGVWYECDNNVFCFYKCMLDECYMSDNCVWDEYLRSDITVLELW